jgi:hypothetical protein
MFTAELLASSVIRRHLEMQIIYFSIKIQESFLNADVIKSGLDISVIFTPGRYVVLRGHSFVWFSKKISNQLSWSMIILHPISNAFASHFL